MRRHAPNSQSRAVFLAGGRLLLGIKLPKSSKDDYASIRQLARIILTVANGGIYFSEAAYQQLHTDKSGNTNPILSPHQIEALSLCASYPDESAAQLAKRLGVADSTLRNLLSNAYVRLKVHTRAAAIAKAQKMGLFPDFTKPE